MLIKALDGRPIDNRHPGSNRRVLLRCDQCGKESETFYYNYVKAQTKCGNTGKTSCKSCIMKARPHPTGEDAHNWRGGRKVGKDGRMLVYNPSPDREGVYTNNAVLVMERVLGRRILPTEHVHHIDGDRTNDAPENLAVLSESEHHVAHRELERMGFCLVKAGLIVFDAAAGTYRTSKELDSLENEPC